MAVLSLNDQTQDLDWELGLIHDTHWLPASSSLSLLRFQDEVPFAAKLADPLVHLLSLWSAKFCLIVLGLPPRGASLPS